MFPVQSKVWQSSGSLSVCCKCQYEAWEWRGKERGGRGGGEGGKERGWEGVL